MTELRTEYEQDTPEWLINAHKADPIVTSLGVASTGGAIYSNGIWEDPTGNERYVGPAMAYYTAGLNIGKLRELDSTARADLNIVITQPPEGEAPEMVRAAVVGSSILVRSELQTNASNVRVHPLDLTMALYNDGKIGAAAWYRDYANSQLKNATLLEGWDFQQSDVNIRDWGANHSYSPYCDIFRPGMLWPFEAIYAFPVELFMDPPSRVPHPLEGGYGIETIHLHEDVRELADNEYSGNIHIAFSDFASRALGKQLQTLRLIQDECSRGHTIKKWDKSSGKVSYFKYPDQVIYDPANGIDLRDRHPLENWDSPMPEPRADVAFYGRTPTLPSLSKEEHAWFYSRQLLGL